MGDVKAVDPGGAWIVRVSGDLGVGVLSNLPEGVFADQFAPTLLGTVLQTMIGGEVRGVAMGFDKIEISPHDHMKVGRDGKESLNLGGASLMMVGAGGQVDIDQAEGKGGGITLLPSGQSDALGVAGESAIEGLGGASVVVVDGRTEHNEGAALIMERVVVNDFPGREARFEGAIVSKSIEFRVLDKNDVRALGKVADVVKDPKSSIVGIGTRGGVSGHGSYIIGRDGGSGYGGV